MSEELIPSPKPHAPQSEVTPETQQSEEVDSLGWTKREREERKTVDQFISFRGSGAGGKTDDTKLAERALAYYANPDTFLLIKKWIRGRQSDPLNEYTQVYREFDLETTLLSLSDRAPEFARSLKEKGWNEIPLRGGLGALWWKLRDPRA